MLIRQGVKDHTVQATFTGGPSAVVIDLEGSLDGSTWYQLAEHTASSAELSDGALMFHVVSKFIRHVRLNLVTFTGGTNLTAIYDAENI